MDKSYKLPSGAFVSNPYRLVGSAPAWDGTGCEFDSWYCRIYLMFIETTNTWVSSGFSKYIRLDTRIVLEERNLHNKSS